MPGKRSLRKVSWMLLICFFTMQTAGETLLHASMVPALPMSGSDHKDPDVLMNFLTELPSEFGSYRETYLPGERPSTAFPMVLHIQDAHANVEAQSRIRDILHWLEDLLAENPSGGHLLIAMEGTTGEIHPEYLNVFPGSPGANEVMVRDLFEKGELTGAELYAWERLERMPHQDDGTASPVEVLLSGVETPELFRDNLKNLRDLLMKRDEIDGLLKPFEAELGIAGSRILNPQLRDFIRDSERLDILPSPVLRHIRETLGIDLTDRTEQIRFPNLARVVHLQEIELFLDVELARLEWAAIKPQIQAAGLDETSLHILENLTPGSPQGILPLREIFNLILEIKPELSKVLSQYPHFMQIVTYRLLSQEIDTKGLISEIDRLKKEIMQKLARNEREKGYLKVYNTFGIYRKALHAELTREEFEGTQEEGQELSTENLMARLGEVIGKEPGTEGYHEATLANREGLERYFSEAMNFYQSAEGRDEALLNNTLRLYREKKEAVSESQKEVHAPWIVVLVTGGFHSEGLVEMMRRDGVPHMVVTPRISKIEKENLYTRVLRRENAEMSDYFDQHSLNKQEALLFRGLVEKAAPALAELEGVSSDQIPLKILEAMGHHPVLSKKLKGVVFRDKDKGREIPALRVGIGAVPRAAAAENQTIGEVGLTTRAELYPALSLEEVPAENQIFGTVRLDFPQSGHAQVVKEPVAVQVLSEIIGNVQATAGQLDEGTMKVLNSAHQQFQKLATTGIFNSNVTGIGAQSLIRHRRPAAPAGMPLPPVSTVPPATGLEKLVAVSPAPAAAPGRSEPQTTVRPELRLRESSEMTVMDRLRVSLASTRDFKEQFFDASLSSEGQDSPGDVLQLVPELGREKLIMNAVADQFYDPDLSVRMEKSTLWRFLQAVLGAGEQKGMQEVPEAVRLVREALGPYAWLLDQTETPVRIIDRLDGKQAYEELFRLVSVMTEANPNVRLAFVVEGNPEEARRYSGQLSGVAAGLHLSVEEIMQRLKFVSSTGAPQDVVRVVKQISSRDKELASAVLDPSEEMLQKIGYIPRLSRIRHEVIGRESAILIAAALIRQLADQYDILRLEDLVSRFNINVQDLVDRVANVIRILNHLATQA